MARTSPVLAIPLCLTLLLSLEATRLSTQKRRNVDTAIGKSVAVNSDCPREAEKNGKDECINSFTMEEVPMECCEGEQECERSVGEAEAAYSARLSQYIIDCKLPHDAFEFDPTGHPAKVIDTSAVCSPECREMITLPVPEDVAPLVQACSQVAPLELQKLADIVKVVTSLEDARLACGGKIGPSTPGGETSGGPPEEFWSGRCSVCPSYLHVHCPSGYAATEERSCGLIHCESKCVKQNSSSYWTGRCTACPASWYDHCIGDTKLVEERGCGFLGLFCEGKCEPRW